MLKGKVAIVTGGTRGIGLATVEKFLENHAAVALAGSRQETANKAVAQLRERYPDAQIMGIAPDLSDTAAVEAAFQQVKEAFGHLDILVNNAGISQRDSLYNYDPADFEKIINLNVNAVFRCTQSAAKIMKEQRRWGNPQHQLYGQPLWPTRWLRLSRFQICRQRIDQIPCSGAGQRQHPGQRSSPRRHPHRYGRRAPGGNGPAHCLYHPFGPDGRT